MGEALLELFDYEGGVSDNLIYHGMANDINASENENVWIIVKNTWFGTNIIQKETMINVAWANRAILPWRT